mgnify:CR=1 FL=1
MKKALCSIAAFAFFLFSSAVYADQISSTNASGFPGSNVSLNVSLDSGDITFGGDFTISYDSSRLSLLDIFGAPDFIPLSGGVPGAMALSLVNAGSGFTAGPIFSLLFSIVSPYPAALPDVLVVDIAGTLNDAAGGINPVPAIAPTITVLQHGGGTVPEPGPFGLIGLAMVIMAGVSYRGRRAGR